MEDLLNHIWVQRHLFIERYGHDEISYIVSYKNLNDLMDYYMKNFTSFAVSRDNNGEAFLFGRPLSWSPLVKDGVKLIIDRI